MSPSEHADLAERLAAAPPSFDGVTPFRQFKPALDDASHPDHGLARLLAGADMVRLPLMSSDTVAERLISGLDPADLDRPAQPADIAAAHQRLFGIPAPPRWTDALQLAPNATIRDLYRSAVATAPFRAACGRISASYRLVTVPSHRTFKAALACSLHSPFAIALRTMRP